MHRPVSADERGLRLLLDLVACFRQPLGASLVSVCAAGGPVTTPGTGLLAMETVTGGALTGGRGGHDRGEEPTQLRTEALLTLAQQGDGEAFGQIYDMYVGSVYRYLYYRAGSHSVAEDLTSETFLRALRRIDSFSWQGRDIGAWFITIARNLVTDHFKSSRFRLEVTTADMLDADRADDGIEQEVLDNLDNVALLRAVRQLKADQQECIILRFLQGLSVAETAAVLNRSEGAVKQLQLRAVRALAAKLSPEEDA